MKGSLCGSGRLAAAGGAEPGGAGIGQGDFKASVKEAFFFLFLFLFFFLFFSFSMGGEGLPGVTGAPLGAA